MEEQFDYFINWYYYISKDHKFLLKKGTYQGFWRFYERPVNGHIWREIEKFPNDFDIITEGELKDYLSGRVHWYYLTIKTDPHKVYYKFG